MTFILLVDVRIDGYKLHRAAEKHVKWEEDTNLIICYDHRYIKYIFTPLTKD